MKTIINIFTIAIIVTSLFSCEDENSPIFIAQEDTDGIRFLNSFASEYLLSEDTKTNIADRLIWSTPNFEVQTNINYQIEGATDIEFNTFKVLGSTSETNFAVLVSNLLAFKSDLEIDENPNTTDTNGLPNNSGILYLRIKAFLGTETPTNVTYTNVQPITISIIENTGDTSCNSLYALGDAIVGVGWNFPGAELVCDSGVLEGKVSLTAGTFRFFQTIGDWDSALNYTHFQNEGYTIDPNLEDAEDGDNNFKFVGTPNIYTITIDNINKTIDLEESSSLWAVGDAVPGGWGFNTDTVELVETIPDVWSASITLSNGIFRFFPNFEDWATSYNYPYYNDDGYTIDADFETQGESDENFKFTGTPGTYTLTINSVNKTITLN